MLKDTKIILINLIWMLFIIYLIFLHSQSTSTIFPIWTLVFPIGLFSLIFLNKKRN